MLPPKGRSSRGSECPEAGQSLEELEEDELESDELDLGELLSELLLDEDVDFDFDESLLEESLLDDSEERFESFEASRRDDEFDPWSFL